MKLIQNNKGIQLAVSYLVTIVIAIFVIILGFRFVNSGLESVEYGLDRIEQQHLSQIERELATSTQKVSLPESYATLSSGGVHTFGLGVKNNLGQRTYFDVSIIFRDARDEEGKQFTPNNVGDWTIQKSISFSLNDLETKVVPLAIATPAAQEGEYRFDVIVKCSLQEDVCDPYAQQIVTINVEG